MSHVLPFSRGVRGSQISAEIRNLEAARDSRLISDWEWSGQRPKWHSKGKKGSIFGVAGRFLPGGYGRGVRRLVLHNDCRQGAPQTRVHVTFLEAAHLESRGAEVQPSGSSLRSRRSCCRPHWRATGATSLPPSGWQARGHLPVTAPFPADLANRRVLFQAWRNVATRLHPFSATRRCTMDV